MIHIYTYGRQSKQALILSRSQADLINRFTVVFSKAQKDFARKNNRPWSYQEELPLEIGPYFTQEDLDRYNKLTNSLNRQHTIRNVIFAALRISVNRETLEDSLVKRI